MDLATLSTERDALHGWWCPGFAAPECGAEALRAALCDLQRPVLLVRTPDGELAVARGGALQLEPDAPEGPAFPLAASLPALPLERLGDRSFCRDHGLRFPYLAGAMANGIGSVELVEALGRAGMLASFGAAGLPLERVEAAVLHLKRSLHGLPFGFNLIHSPAEPALEAGAVEIYLRHGIRLVEASAFLDLTLPLLRYRLAGIHEDAQGHAIAPNRVIAKLSRVEVAEKFLSPAPERLLERLVSEGTLSAAQARLARRVPVAQDLTAEADSGGHTDNRPALALLPTLLALRDRMQQRHPYGLPLRVGLAGGIATPAAAAAAFTMGAAWVLSGSVNQACVESGTSDAVRAMLAEARQADVCMAPAADMFEMGVQVQVLKRGTLFPMRARKLYELYRSHDSLEALSAAERAALEQKLFRAPLAEIWTRTQRFFQERDPAQLARAATDAKHRMALVFRWYLGLSSAWANEGDPDRRLDYQVWCGPAMGAFNEWVAGSPLERPAERRVVAVALNILYGAALQLRRAELARQGVQLPAGLLPERPLPLHAISARTG